MWSESGRVESDAAAQTGLHDIVTTRRPPTSYSEKAQFVAEKLQYIRIEVDAMGMLIDGRQGTYYDVAHELEP